MALTRGGVLTDTPRTSCSTEGTKTGAAVLMILQAVELTQTRGQTCLTSMNQFPPEEGQGVGERGGGATVAGSDRGFTGV